MKHLAIMRQPWLNLLKDGKKSIESRVSINKRPPYGQVKKGDLVYFRQSGDFVVFLKGIVKDVQYFTQNILETLRAYRNEICIDEEYIQSKQKCRYLTLIWFESIEHLGLNVFPHTQKGQQAWFCNLEEGG